VQSPQPSKRAIRSGFRLRRPARRGQRRGSATAISNAVAAASGCGSECPRVRSGPRVPVARESAGRALRR
jgi:hypothetical protein